MSGRRGHRSAIQDRPPVCVFKEWQECSHLLQRSPTLTCPCPYLNESRCLWSHSHSHPRQALLRNRPHLTASRIDHRTAYGASRSRAAAPSLLRFSLSCAGSLTFCSMDIYFIQNHFLSFLSKTMLIFVSSLWQNSMETRLLGLMRTSGFREFPITIVIVLWDM